MLNIVDNKKYFWFILIFNSVFSQDIDNSFNMNHSGPYTECIGENPVLLSTGKIIATPAILYNSDGSKDTTTPFIKFAMSSLRYVNAFNDKIIGFNYDDSISLYNYDGSLDTNFVSPVFTSTFSPEILNAKMDPDGKILVCGYFTQVNGISRKNIVRLNPNGSVDTSFTFDPLINDLQIIESFIRQNDGKYIVGGFFKRSINSTFNYINLVRVNSDGSLDTSFYNFTNPFFGFDTGVIKKIYIQPDGKYIIVGPNFKSSGNFLSRGITRLNVNGTRDSSFNCTYGGYGLDASIMPDGKILFSNSSNVYNLKKLNSNGTIDNTFIYQNTNYAPLHADDLQLCPDGKILINSSYISPLGITRENYHKINSNGTLDFTFNPQQSSNNPIKNMAVLQDGNILIASYNLTAYNDTPCKRLIKLNTEGEIDTTFNLDNQIQNIPNTNIYFREQSDNKILIGVGGYLSGSGGQSIMINSIAYKFIRLNSNGTLDNTFNPAISNNLRHIEVLENNKILIIYYNATINKNILTRLNYDGSMDNDFQSLYSDNKYMRKFQDGTFFIKAKIPTSNINSRIYKLNTDGTINSTLNFQSVEYTLKDILKQNDKYLIDFATSSTTGLSKIRRINVDGSVDPTFNEINVVHFKTFLNSENKIILVGGNNNILIYDSNGNYEQTFNFNFSIDLLYQQFCDKFLIQGGGEIYDNFTNGCVNFDLIRYNISSNQNLVNPPTGETIQTVSSGNTLQDLTVIGQNINWYNSQSSCGLNLTSNGLNLIAKTSIATDNNLAVPLFDTPLPINTTLINNNTYYASQTINGIESSYRLPVKVNLSLNLTSFSDSNFLVLNPVQDLLKIYGKKNIMKVEIYNLMGHRLKSFNFNEELNKVEIDINDLNSNIYFVTIYSNEYRKTLKIIKE